MFFGVSHMTISSDQSIIRMRISFLQFPVAEAPCGFFSGIKEIQVLLKVSVYTRIVNRKNSSSPLMTTGVFLLVYSVLCVQLSTAWQRPCLPTSPNSLRLHCRDYFVFILLTLDHLDTIFLVPLPFTSRIRT